MAKKPAKRIFFGLAISAFIVLLLLLEGWLALKNYHLLPNDRLRGLLLGLVVALIAASGSLELVKMARLKSLSPSPVLMGFLPAVIVLYPFWIQSRHLPILANFLLGGMLLAALVQGIGRGTQNTLGNLGCVCFAAIYLGLGLSTLIRIRLLGSTCGTVWGQIAPLLLFLATVKCADVGAYFTGRFFGRHLWAPKISPAKTWEGFVGGIILAIIVASLFSLVSGIISLSVALVFGLIVAVSGQLGDLLESMLKRDAGSKDSAQLVPEFGGILDMVDSVIVAAPFAYGIFIWVAAT